MKFIIVRVLAALNKDTWEQVPNVLQRISKDEIVNYHEMVVGGNLVTAISTKSASILTDTPIDRLDIELGASNLVAELQPKPELSESPIG